jgi:signal transduction histidine kinase
VVDLGVAVVVTIATVGPVLVGHAPWWVLVAAVLAAVPVLWRRRAPVRVLLVVGPAITVLAAAHSLPALPYGTLICAYTIAADSPAVLRRGTLILGGIGVLVSLIVPAEALYSYGYAAMSFATAWALGTGVRARRTQIAMLQERARRLDEERAAAVQRERVRIARDMHDIVAHSVGLMIVQAETGPLLTHTDPARADDTFAGIADTGREAVRQLRHSLGVLREDTADPPQQPGIAAIADLVAATCRSGLAASLDEHGRPRAVPGEIGVTAYRVVQEALTNTRKHADASVVRVSLRWHENGVTVEVVDDGNGPRFEALRGRGLLGMRERVSACGGTLRHGSAGTGFEVIAELPLTQGD